MVAQVSDQVSPDQISPDIVQAFYDAYAARDIARLESLIADDVKWNIVGPSHIFPFCGERRGKAAVLDLFRNVFPDAIHFRGIEQEVLLIDGDRAAAFVNLSGYMNKSGRPVTYHCGQFIRFRDGKIVCYRSIIDSFDAAEQALGHQIDPMHEPAQRGFTNANGVVSV